MCRGSTLYCLLAFRDTMLRRENNADAMICGFTKFIVDSIVTVRPAEQGIESLPERP